MVRTVAFIPLRGGSKSIPLKNIKPLAGQPLAYWVMKAALSATEITEVVVASDSEVIRNTLQNLAWSPEEKKKLSIIDRSSTNASDTASTESVVLEYAEHHDFDRLVLIQATSPLLKGWMLSEALELMNSKGFDSLLSVVRQKRFIWEVTPETARSVNYDYRNRPRRQDFEGHLVENGAFYVTSKKGLMTSKNRMSGRIGVFEMPDETYVEIDEPVDWQIVEALLLESLKADKK